MTEPSQAETSAAQTVHTCVVAKHAYPPRGARVTYVLAIDQGTTSTRSILFDACARVVAGAQAELAQHYRQDGWVEHDGEDIWRGALETARRAIRRAAIAPTEIAAIGIANQRETTLLWDRATGAPLHNAIAWQDRRTADVCAELKAAGHEPFVQARTGLLLDPYFSATKLAWLLDRVPGARTRADAGELAFGTVDSFLLWRLTGGRIHATDAVNASRTLLFDIHAQAWSPALLDLFRIPAAVLPEVRDNSGTFGVADPALIGQACFSPGMAKATYGTGCFMLVNTGAWAVASDNRLLTTVGYRLGGETTYAVEGSIFVAGAGVKWLRDGLGLITHASDTHDMATRVADNGGVHLVPAFTGLGAPHWRPDARGVLSGLTLASTAAHVARAALEAVGYQTADLLDAMMRDGTAMPTTMRVDGGMSANDWLCQFLADVLDVPVERPADLETTASGAAFLAGLAVGVWNSLDEVATLVATGERFVPRMKAGEREALREGWRRALERALL